MFDGIMFVLIVVIVVLLLMSLRTGKASINKNIHTQKQRMAHRSESDISVECITGKKVRLVVIFILMMVVFVVSFLPFALGR